MILKDFRATSPSFLEAGYEIEYDSGIRWKVISKIGNEYKLKVVKTRKDGTSWQMGTKFTFPPSQINLDFVIVEIPDEDIE